MRVIVQRVKKARVEVDQEVKGQIEAGFLLLVGIAKTDQEENIRWMAKKIAHLRVFEDENQKLNLSLLDKKYPVLSVSQFTLYGDTKRGNRPSFTEAASGDEAIRLFELFNDALHQYGIHVESGVFGAYMDVHLVNDGPVTIIIDSDAK
ncbi:MAG: D-aminoacyl-tRNA deacylase [Acholeplasmataceae bacterium]|nr:D-aminoacyl-tRNA deacylase [Acholeplasmataceae bacterium]